MNTFLISYDLLSPDNNLSDYERVKEYIKSFPRWAKPLESVWLIKTSKQCSEVRDELIDLVGASCKILVMDVSKTSWATYNVSTEVTNWIKENL